MFTYSFIQKPNFKINTDTVDRIFNSISKDVSTPQAGVVNLVFVSWEKIQELNKNYRKKDSVTDVLSFHYHDDFSTLWDEEIAGEIIFCEEKIISQGQEYGLGSEKEFYKLLIHSVLHLLWYDHEEDDEYEEMKKWEEKIWEDVFPSTML